MSNVHPRILIIALLLAPLLALGGAMGPAHPVSAAAGITLSRYRAAPGDSVTVRGTGFRSGDPVVASGTFVTAHGTNVVQTVATVGGDGSFSAPFTVPGNAIAGPDVVSAQDFHGDTATTRLIVLPKLYLPAGGKTYTTYVQANNDFFVSGSGFSANATVSVKATFPLYNGNSVLVSKDVKTDGSGQFHELLLSVPNDAKAGTAAITATGPAPKQVANGKVVVFYRPAITPGAGFVAPGAGLVVHGGGFAPGEQIDISLTVSRNGLPDVTITRTVTTTQGGNFVATLYMPSAAKNGTYTVTASGRTTHSKASAKFTVSVHPSISLKENNVLPGEPLDVSGGGFGSRVGIRVYATFSIQGGGNRTDAVNTASDSAGGFTARLFVPSNANPGTVPVYARSSNGQTSANLTIRPRPAPTATPVPTQAPTPAATQPPLQPTSTPVPPAKKKHSGFYYRYVSIWYHTVRQGTYDVLSVQAGLKTTLGIWAHVWFPNGYHHDFYQNTNSHGFWQVKFSVPRGTRTATNDNVIVTVRLWHGKKSIKEFLAFRLV